jgi:hypothetical protein
MKAKWLLLILLAIAFLTGSSQSEKCFATVPLKCGDTIVDYLTAKEKKNLYKLQLTLERQKATIEYLESNGRADSCYIDELRGTVSGLETQVAAMLEAKRACDKGFDLLDNAVAKLNRQIKLLKLKNVFVGAFTAVGSFGAGVGVAFVIIKAQ